MAAGSMVFRPDHRLRQSSDFAAVLASPLKLRGRHFEVRYRGAAGSMPRLGLIVPKRLAKRAVVRNTLKRLSREAFRTIHKQLPCVDLVVRLTADVGRCSKVSAETKKGWRKELDQLMLRLKP